MGNCSKDAKRTSGIIQQRIRELLAERSWSPYMLSKLSGLDYSTIRKYLAQNAEPSFASLEAMCNAFEISVAQFFLNDNLTELTGDQRQLLAEWSRLSSAQKKLFLALMHNIDNG